MAALLEARRLSAGYGAAAVVRDLDLEVHPGEVVGLLGPNGAGKTTTLLTLAGELPPLGGEIFWRGTATRAPLHRRARQGLAIVTEEKAVYMRLTAAENLRVARGDVDAAVSLFPELKARLKLKAGLMSGGEQQMLALAGALSRRPALLLADELSLGLAPIVVRRLLLAVRAAADERGVGVLLVEQHVRKVLEVADRVYVMRRGTVVLSGSAAEFRDRVEDIEASYMAASVAPDAQRPGR
jgi:branched-chain amino acid transport system ATP-binding protein